jgi:hypothetical protein
LKLKKKKNVFLDILSTNRVLRRIFGPKRDEETGGWRGTSEVVLFSKYN